MLKRFDSFIYEKRGNVDVTITPVKGYGEPIEISFGVTSFDDIEHLLTDDFLKHKWKITGPKAKLVKAFDDNSDVRSNWRDRIDLMYFIIEVLSELSIEYNDKELITYAQSGLNYIEDHENGDQFREKFLGKYDDELDYVIQKYDDGELYMDLQDSYIDIDSVNNSYQTEYDEMGSQDFIDEFYPDATTVMDIPKEFLDFKMIANDVYTIIFNKKTGYAMHERKNVGLKHLKLNESIDVNSLVFDKYSKWAKELTRMLKGKEVEISTELSNHPNDRTRKLGVVATPMSDETHFVTVESVDYLVGVGFIFSTYVNGWSVDVIL